MDKLISKDEIYKFGRTYHFNAIALNKTGLKIYLRLFLLRILLIYIRHQEYLGVNLMNLEKDLLLVVAADESEVFLEARSKEGEELTNIINFYDYVEVQPPEVYGHLIQTSDFKDDI